MLKVNMQKPPCAYPHIRFLFVTSLTLEKKSPSDCFAFQKYAKPMAYHNNIDRNLIGIVDIRRNSG
jgi:hypothetical protein